MLVLVRNVSLLEVDLTGRKEKPPFSARSQEPRGEQNCLKCTSAEWFLWLSLLDSEAAIAGIAECFLNQHHARFCSGPYNPQKRDILDVLSGQYSIFDLFRRLGPIEDAGINKMGVDYVISIPYRTLYPNSSNLQDAYEKYESR